MLRLSLITDYLKSDSSISRRSQIHASCQCGQQLYTANGTEVITALYQTALPRLHDAIALNTTMIMMTANIQDNRDILSLIPVTVYLIEAHNGLVRIHPKSTAWQTGQNYQSLNSMANR